MEMSGKCFLANFNDYLKIKLLTTPKINNFIVTVYLSHLLFNINWKTGIIEFIVNFNFLTTFDALKILKNIYIYK